MNIWYDEKIENTELGYTLYLDFKGNREYWYDHNTFCLYPSKEAGGMLCTIPIMCNYKLRIRDNG